MHLDIKSIKQSATGALLAIITFILITSAFPATAAAATTPSVYFSFTMIAPNTNPVRVQWAEIIQNSYQSNGIGANLVFTAFGPLIDRVWGGTPGLLFSQGGYDAIFLGWGGGTVLPDWGTDNVVNYRSSQPAADFPPNGNNYAFFDNATYNTLANEYAVSFNVTQRQQLAQQMVSIVAQQRPFLIILYPLSDVGVANNVFPWNQQTTWDYTALSNGDFQHWKVTGTNPTINVAISGDVNCQYDIPTGICNSQYNSWLTSGAQEGLQQFNPVTKEYINGLATSITSSPNHLTWTVVFKAHTFQDSVPVTANDYIFTYMYDQIGATGYVGLGTYQSIFGLNTEYHYTNGTTDYVMNGTYYHATPPAGFTPTAVFTAFNNDTFTFTMPQPYPFTNPSITDIAALPMHILQDIPPSQLATSWWITLQNTPKTITWNTQQFGGNGSYAWAYGVVGDGAYHYTGYDKVAQVGTYQKWSGFWNATGLQSIGEFSANTIHIVHILGKDSALAAFKNGQVNVLDTNYQFNKADTQAITAAGGVNLYINSQSNGWQELGLNLHDPVFGTGTATPLGQSNPSQAPYAAMMVRKAMSYLIPRDQIVNQLLQGMGTPGITQFCTCYSAYMPAGLAPDPYDPTAALGFLAAAGYNTGVTPPSTGTSTNLGSVSITIPSSNITVPSFLLGNSFTLSGVYTPVPQALMVPSGGFAVVLEQSSNGTNWLPVASTFTNTGGYFSITYTPTVTGSLQYRLFYTAVNASYALANGYGSPGAIVGLVPPVNPSAPDWRNVTTTSYGPTSSLQIGSLAEVLSQLASGAQLSALTSQLQSSLSGMSSSVNTLTSGQQTANSDISSLKSSVGSVQSNVSGVAGQISTLSTVAYLALAVAIILGLIAIALSRRKAPAG